MHGYLSDECDLLLVQVYLKRYYFPISLEMENFDSNFKKLQFEISLEGNVFSKRVAGRFNFFVA